jgi:hypothetical protein
MAEFLILAQNRWDDTKDTSSLTPDELYEFESRQKKGDIVAVRPDGWAWGNKEKLPLYIVVKVPQISYEDAKLYEQRLEEIQNGEVKPKRFRRYQIPESWIDNLVSQGISEYTVTKNNLNQNMIDKALS